ncbi:hypothetical protein [Actinoplanes sp. NPDC026619]|uniref:hypothetical protein n=1 Tax=Actinoplanes sp. NPDC026619 TaxID=3155798 RepID=UPI0033C6FAA2
MAIIRRSMTAVDLIVRAPQGHVIFGSDSEPSAGRIGGDVLAIRAGLGYES